MSVDVKEIKVIEVRDSNGNVLLEDYPIMIRIKNQDIVCAFKEIANGYFVTKTLDGEHENKYRQGSIEHCQRISGIRKWPEPLVSEKRETIGG